MISKIIYSLLFWYITFEGFHEFFRDSLTKHINAKKKYKYLKESENFWDDFRYTYYSKICPIFSSLVNKKVFLAIAVFTAHHWFVSDLLDKLGDLKTEKMVEAATKIGIYSAGIFGGLLAWAETHPVGNSATHSSQSKLG